LGDDFCKSKRDHRYRASPDFPNEGERPESEGSRCDSFKSGGVAFNAAVTNDKSLSAIEKEALINARASMTFKCDNPTPQNTQADGFFSGSSPTAEAKEFGVYLSGAKAFYEGSFDYANEQFKKLYESKNAWLRQTATYMVARSFLNKSQVGAFAELDGMARPKVTDNVSLKSADTQFRAYLSQYPKGIYASSAKGLLRRLYWLSGNERSLSKEYTEQISRLGDSGNSVNSVDLAQEIDNKLLNQESSHIDDPIFLATNFLRKMRSSDGDKTDFSEKELLQVERHFSTNPALFNFLKAARAYYVDGNLDQAARYLDVARPEKIAPNYVNFSTEILRGQIMLASKKLREAEDHWLRTLPIMTMPWQRQAIELGLAMTWERMGLVSKIVESGTEITSPKIKSIVLRYVSGPILLREAISSSSSPAEEKALARFTLLFKEATRGQYANFLKDFNPDALNGEVLSPTGVMKLSAFLWQGQGAPYNCPALKSVVEELSRSPESSHGQICLAEFVRHEDLDSLESVSPKPDELGGGKDIFPGSIYSRGEIYKKLIEKPSISDNDKAYALYRAVYCYSPTGINGCGGKDVAKEQRKNWYGLLKSKYGSTPWAREIKYYW
jgi:tetratricopeptide (TPR) repeat protein